MGSNPTASSKGFIMSDGGKGDNPRPMDVDRQTFENNWDAIFKKPQQDPKPQQPENHT